MKRPKYNEKLSHRTPLNYFILDFINSSLPLLEILQSPETRMSNTETLRPEKLSWTQSFQWAAEARPGTERRMELALVRRNILLEVGSENRCFEQKPADELGNLLVYRSI